LRSWDNLSACIEGSVALRGQNEYVGHRPTSAIPNPFQLRNGRCYRHRHGGPSDLRSDANQGIGSEARVPVCERLTIEYSKDNDDDDKGEERDKPVENLRCPSVGDDPSEE